MEPRISEVEVFPRSPLGRVAENRRRNKSLPGTQFFRGTSLRLELREREGGLGRRNGDRNNQYQEALTIYVLLFWGVNKWGGHREKVGREGREAMPAP